MESRLKATERLEREYRHAMWLINLMREEYDYRDEDLLAVFDQSRDERQRRQAKRKEAGKKP